MADIGDEDIRNLIKYFSEKTYEPAVNDVMAEAIMQTCILLSNSDYVSETIPNFGGELCPQYPSQLILFEKEKNPLFDDLTMYPNEYSNESNCDFSDFKEKVKVASIARCRERFPVPVLLYKNRHICRSATLANAAEIYTRLGIKYIYSNNKEEKVKEVKASELDEEEIAKNWKFMNFLSNARNKDIDLLKSLDVGVISDLMVENKKQKFGFYVSSSEKIDKENRYSDFTIMSLPYPGCEFFQKLRGNNYAADNLFYDWTQNFVDAEISVPDEHSTDIAAQLQIEWKDYRKWDLITMTQNYIQLILKYLTDGNSSLLIHCISGWDRTPLFISLLRLSLWADGVAHRSLTPHQMLYFTIAYDWFLFGHNLKDRLSKNEEIFYFCFYFLKYLYKEDYSVHRSNSMDESYDMLDGCEIPSLSTQLSAGSNQSVFSQNGCKDIQDTLPPQFFPIDPQDDELINGNGMPSSPNRDLITTNGSPRSPLTTYERTPPRLSNCTPPLSAMVCNRTPTPQLGNATKGTSPVPVPVTSHRLRSRTESNSSDSSFCIVTTTGSVSSSLMSQCPVMEGACSNLTSTDTLIEERLIPRRRERLEKLREIAISAYSKVIGMHPF